MIAECSQSRTIPTTVLAWKDFESYDSEDFQAVSPTSKTIKERDKVAILFILRTHEAFPETEKISHAYLPSTCVTWTTESGRPNSRMSADECVYTHFHCELLPHIRVFPQETSGHRCRV